MRGLVAGWRASLKKDSKDNKKDAGDGEDCLDIREGATCTPVAESPLLFFKPTTKSSTVEEGLIRVA